MVAPMAENINARTRLLHLIEILTMYSDEQNILSIEEICEWLSEYGYDVSKRLILSDIKLINTTPIKIINVSKPKKGYYIAKCYSQSAISLILEAIFSSDVLSESDIEYIKRYLRRNTCLPTLDLILNTTVNLNSLVPKRDFSAEALYNLRLAVRDKKRALLKVSRIVPGDVFSTAEILEDVVVNPILIAVSNGAVALIFSKADTPKKAEFINMPRIKSVEIINEESTEFTDDVTHIFNYFDGKPSKSSSVTIQWLVIRFKAEDIEFVENHFSSPIQYRKDTDGYYIAKVMTAINNDLIGWLFTYSEKIELISPSSLKGLFEEKKKTFKG